MGSDAGCSRGWSGARVGWPPAPVTVTSPPGRCLAVPLRAGCVRGTRSPLRSPGSARRRCFLGARFSRWSPTLACVEKHRNQTGDRRLPWQWLPGARARRLTPPSPAVCLRGPWPALRQPSSVEGAGRECSRALAVASRSLGTFPARPLAPCLKERWLTSRLPLRTREWVMAGGSVAQASKVRPPPQVPPELLGS